MIRLLIIASLLFIIQTISAQSLQQLRYRDFPVLENTDSLEQAIQLQKNNSSAYLDEYAQFRDQVFTIISHDLRSPVTALERLSRQAGYLKKGIQI